MKQNKAIRTISYILLPVFIAIIIISVVYTFAKDSYGKNMNNYFETTSFTNDYMALLSSLARRTVYMNDNYSYAEDGKYKIYYTDLDNYDTRLKNHYVIIVYKNKVMTNISVQGKNTLEEMKRYIEEQNGEKLKIINGEVKKSSMTRKLK